MRRAQLRLRQLGTMVAIAVFVAAAFVSLPKSHAAGPGARAAAQLVPAHRPPPNGRRWS